MNARLVKLALAFGTLALTTNCTATTNSSQPHSSQKVAQVSSTQTIAATGDIRIDGSSTVYPITQAIARSAVPKGQSLKRLTHSRTARQKLLSTFMAQLADLKSSVLDKPTSLMLLWSE